MKLYRRTNQRSDESVSVFYQAWASDSINEIHPEKLSGFLPTQTFKKFNKEEKVRSASFLSVSDENFDEYSFLSFKESELEKAIISVADLKKQFIKNSREKRKEKTNHLKSPRAKTPNGSTKSKGSMSNSNIVTNIDGSTIDGALTGDKLKDGDQDGCGDSELLTPMNANIAALSKRFSNFYSTLTLPGQEPKSGERGREHERGRE